ncbi:MAG: hypothetical protein IJZ29_04410 [Clostridia bacterium]|nr:hypothetical protein [Clostridia bacterium]
MLALIETMRNAIILAVVVENSNKCLLILVIKKIKRNFFKRHNAFD